MELIISILGSCFLFVAIHLSNTYRAYVKHWRKINKDDDYYEF
jgi:hypothetical protein